MYDAMYIRNLSTLGVSTLTTSVVCGVSPLKLFVLVKGICSPRECGLSHVDNDVADCRVYQWFYVDTIPGPKWTSTTDTRGLPICQ